jgi:toxin ParE1/3/4
VKVSISPPALVAMEEIGTYIERDNPARARSFVEELIDACYDLSSFPRRFPPVPQFGPNAHKRTLGNYLIIYDVLEDRVEVTAVRHASRSV